MTATMNMDSIQKKFTLLAATLMLAFGFNAAHVQEAQAGRDGRVIAGVIAGAALVGILASRRDRHRGRYYNRPYHYHGRRSARCYRSHAGYNYRGYRGQRYGRSHRRHRGHRGHRGHRNW